MKAKGKGFPDMGKKEAFSKGKLAAKKTTKTKAAKRKSQ